MTLDAARWRSVEFIADLHLCAELPRTAEALLEHLRHSDADAIMLLGDIFEAWVGDDMALPLDRTRAPADADFERSFSADLAAIAATRWIGFMVGNRDFLVGADWAAACHLHPLADPTRFTLCGQQVLLSHGDELCLADVEYQQFRAQVRGDTWRQAFLAKPLAERLSIARQMRQASTARQQAQHGRPSCHDGGGDDQHCDAPPYADVDHPAALASLRATGTHTLVHGHTHRPGRHVLEQTDGQVWQRLVLSDWDLDHTTPARAEVLRLDNSGFARLPPRRSPAVLLDLASDSSPGSSSGRPSGMSPEA
ncbi:MAG: UDP-2,3-diacylglucosamine diphosphatase [Burkholderiales bacterium]|nr:UDP-2,3-diacylglucosamine diphosphatase [Burkholderiales bacterium]